jgi:restriction endonuclease
MDYCQTAGLTIALILDLLGLKFKRIYKSHFLNIIRDMKVNFIPKYRAYAENQMFDEPQNAPQYFGLPAGQRTNKDDNGIEYVYQDIDRIIEIVDSLLAP